MIRREPHASRRIPFRVGAVLDWPPSAAARRDVLDALRVCFEDAAAAKRLDRAVELSVREVAGSPLAALDAWRELVAEDAELVLGPHGDAGALAVAAAMTRAPYPTVSACSTSLFSSEFGFTLGAGNAADEAVLAADLHHARCHHVGVLHDAGPSGVEAFESFALHARELGVTLAGEASAAPPFTVDSFFEALRELAGRGATAVQVFVPGFALDELAAAARRAADDVGFRPQFVMGSGFAARHALEGFDPRALEGWIGLDLRDERNAIGRAFLDRFEEVWGRRPAHAYALVARDLAEIAIHALATAKPHSPEGIKNAIERLRFWPAAAGGPDTSISIAPFDHRAYKGAYLLFRTIRGGVDRPAGVPTRLEPAEGAA